MARKDPAVSAALDRALERNDRLLARRLQAPRQSEAGRGGGAALLAAASGEASLASQLGRGSFGPSHEQQYQRNRGWTFACVRAIAQRWAGQPLRVARSRSRSATVPRSLRPHRDSLPRHLKARQENLELLEDHPILETLDRPNALMVRWALSFVTASSLELTGRCYWWTYKGDPGSPTPWTIMPLPSNWVEPRHQGGKLNSSWLVKPPGVTQPVEVPGEEIACIYYPDPGNPLGALSPLQAMARAVSANESISEAQRRAFNNSIWAGYAVTVGRNPDVNGQQGARPTLTKEQRGQVINAILQAYRGVINYDQPIILDGLIESITKVSNTPREMDFLKSHALTKEQITQGFGVNPIIMGQIEGVNRASAAAADDIYCSNCINPKLELVSQILTAFVAPRLASGSERLVLYYEPAHAYDPDLELTRWKFLAGLAAADNNEIRTSLGLPPRPGGNVALMPPGVTPYDLETSYDFSEPEPAPAPALPGAGAGPAANGHAGNGKPPGGNGSGGGNGKPPAGGGIDDVDNIDRGTDRSFRRLGVYVSGG
jgi:phage portal protein BeeE